VKPDATPEGASSSLEEQPEVVPEPTPDSDLTDQPATDVLPSNLEASLSADDLIPNLVTAEALEPSGLDTAELEDGVYIPEDEVLEVQSAPSSASVLEAPSPDAVVAVVSDEEPVLKSTGIEDHPAPIAQPAPDVPQATGEGFLEEDGFLEEETLAMSTATPPVKLERGEYTVTGFDPVGRKLATSPDGAEVVIASYQGGAAVTRALYPHPMLPPLLDAGEEDGKTLIAHPRLQGRTLEDAFKDRELKLAVRTVLDLARFNRYLSARGFALTGLEPREVLLTPTRLSRLPSVRKIGDAAPAEAPRYGAPERAAGTSVSGMEGVYTLGAMLFHALEGRALEEGEMPSSFVELPGAPQALTAMLAPTSQRANPQEALELIAKLEVALSKRYRWLVGQSSTVGINSDRSTNEDSCGAIQRATHGDGGPELQLVACVADGMGGMAKGEDASQAAVRGFLSFEAHDATKAAAVEATSRANTRVIEIMEGKSGGCTFTGVIAEGDRVVVAHVGDTRAYLVSDQLVEQLTEDHSMVMMLVKMGVIPPEAAHNHPDSNKVMRALGSNRVLPPDYVDTVEITVRPGAKIVLLSDGVWGPILPTDLEAMLLQDGLAQDLADALVRAALKAGSSDNATAMVLHYEERDPL
jgi:PPM family protein phosphatase